MGKFITYTDQWQQSKTVNNNLSALSDVVTTISSFFSFGLVQLMVMHFQLHRETDERCLRIRNFREIYILDLIQGY